MSSKKKKKFFWGGSADVPPSVLYYGHEKSETNQSTGLQNRLHGKCFPRTPREEGQRLIQTQHQTQGEL